mmetsp:Transcript_28123/g.74242  ORF Transcript_28123/g.74242 Transcript_28123/m.74242 type:complete len:283 (+) Transcript_28123:116-964(+)
MNTFVRDGFGCASADSSIGRPIFPNAYPPHVTQDLHIANFTSCVDPSPFLHSSARNIPSNLVNLDFADQDNTLAKRQGRAILTDDQARIIFKYKPSPFAKDRGRAGALARAFGVSVKTIRDIWIGRTWYRATFDLDPGKQDEVPNRLHKKPGRPRGAKDSKPRTKKAKKTLPDPQVLKTPTMASSQESHIMPQIDQESHTVPQMDQCHNMPRVSPPMQMMFNYDHRWQNTTSFQSPFPAASQAKSAWMNQKVTRSHDGSLSLSDHRRLNETLSTTTGHFGAV